MDKETPHIHVRVTASMNVREKIRAYLQVMRLDHWFKNVFVIIGACGYFAYTRESFTVPHLLKICLAVGLSCLVSTINYIMNEILDASYDIWHPRKKNRPIPSGRISLGILYIIMVLIFVVTYTISFAVFSQRFSRILLLFFLFGLIYNVRPIRAKEIPYIDAIVESANNPIRVALGWYSFADPGTSLPLSAVLFFWVYGAFLMTGKRLAELRFLGEHALPYRITFKYYSESSLLTLMYVYAVVSIGFYVYMISFVFPFHPLSIVGLVLLLLFFIWCHRLVKEEDSILKEPERLLKKPAFFIFCFFGLIIVIIIFLL